MIAVDTNGLAYDCHSTSGSGFFSSDRRRTRGIPTRGVSYTITQPRALDEADAVRWATLGASGVLAGRAEHGVIRKTPEQLRSESDWRTAMY